MRKVYKRKRSRRPLRRRRLRRARKSGLATKAYVRKATMKALEAKRTTELGVLTHLDEQGYVGFYVGSNISVGVTDRGRIGNTINLTGLSVRWKISAQFVNEEAVLPTVHIVMIQPKNGWSLPASRFYKAFDNAQVDPYEPLSYESMNDGRRWMNTDDLIILKKYKKLILKNDNVDDTITTGTCSLKHKRKMIINQNGTGSPTVGDVNPPIWIYIYVTYGDEAKYGPANAHTLSYAINTYYRD